MIEIVNKQNCCGCTACASICPRQCITMKSDDEGFMYPSIDKAKCIDCHLCKEKCPVLGRKKISALPGVDKAEINRKAVEEAKYIPSTYVCFLKDDKIREKSTSGGMFTALAQHVLKQGGIVCGVVLDKNQNVLHTFADNENTLEKMRGSKYVQSNQVGIYQKVEEALKQGTTVLYSGTPCQIAGLKSYLGSDYEKLITVDIICHGVGSPLYWEKYVQYVYEKMNSKVKEVRFREKTYGYNSACMAVYFENGKSSHKGHDDDLYWTAFSKNYIYRPSCYACAFKSINHMADFTIGDFWNSTKLSEKFKTANGCSLVLCHSNVAIEIIKKIGSTIEAQPIDLIDALNINGGHQASMLVACPSIPTKRKEWFDDMQKLSPQELVKKYIPIRMKGKIKSRIKPLLYKIGLLETIKKQSHETDH